MREVEAFARPRRAAGPARDRTRGRDRVRGGPGLSRPGPGRRTRRFARLCRELTGTSRPTKVSFGTEGGCFVARGIPALVCGPGDIKVAHKPDEWIALEQLERCDAFLRELTRALLS